jgi:hypothetical protein
MPIPTVSPSGVTVIDVMVGAVTVRAVDWDTPAKLAEIFVVPAAAPVASPLPSIVAMLVEDELHVTRLLMSAALPSL